MAVNNSRVRRNLMAELNAAEGEAPNGNVNGGAAEQDPPPPNGPNHIQFVEEELARATQEASDKYNFDFRNFRPLDGDWEWKLPHEEFASPDENVEGNAKQGAQQQPEPDPANQEPAP